MSVTTTPLLEDLRWRGLTAQVAAEDRLGRAAGGRRRDGLLRVRPDRRLAAHRPSRAAALPGPLPAPRAPADRAGRRRNRADRRPVRALRGADPELRGDGGRLRPGDPGAARAADGLRGRGDRREQRRVAARPDRHRAAAGRRQALPDGLDAGQGVGALAHGRRRHLVHRVQLHGAAGVRLPAPQAHARLPDPDRRQRPVRQHHRRDGADPAHRRRLGGRDDRAADHHGFRAEVRQDRRPAPSGSTRGGRRRTPSTSSGSTPTTATPCRI